MRIPRSSNAAVPSRPATSMGKPPFRSPLCPSAPFNIANGEPSSPSIDPDVEIQSICTSRRKRKNPATKIVAENGIVILKEPKGSSGRTSGLLPVNPPKLPSIGDFLPSKSLDASTNGLTSIRRKYSAASIDSSSAVFSGPPLTLVEPLKPKDTSPSEEESSLRHTILKKIKISREKAVKSILPVLDSKPVEERFVLQRNLHAKDEGKALRSSNSDYVAKESELPIHPANVSSPSPASAPVSKSGPILLKLKVPRNVTNSPTQLIHKTQTMKIGSDVSKEGPTSSREPRNLDVAQNAKIAQLLTSEDSPLVFAPLETIDLRQRFDMLPEAVKYELINSLPNSMVSIESDGRKRLKDGCMGFGDTKFRQLFSDWLAHLRRGEFDAEKRRACISVMLDEVDVWKLANFEPVYGSLMTAGRDCPDSLSPATIQKLIGRPGV